MKLNDECYCGINFEYFIDFASLREQEQFKRFVKLMQRNDAIDPNKIDEALDFMEGSKNNKK